MSKLTYNQLRSKLNGSGLSMGQRGEIWSLYKIGEINDQDLDNIELLSLKVPKKKIVRRVSLIKRPKKTVIGKYKVTPTISPDVMGTILKFVPGQDISKIVAPGGKGYLKTTLIHYPFDFGHHFDEYKFKKTDFHFLMKNVNIDIILREAATRGYVDIIKKRISFKIDIKTLDHLLFVASLYNKPKVMKLLLLDGRANPSRSNNFILSYAAQKGQLKIVKLILAHEKFSPSSDDVFRKAAIFSSRNSKSVTTR